MRPPVNWVPHVPIALRLLRKHALTAVALLAALGKADASVGLGGDGETATSAKFRFNYGGVLSFDAPGNLYIIDPGNNRVRAVRGPLP